MTTKKNHISNSDFNTSQKFDGNKNTIAFCLTFLPENCKSKINNQYKKIEYKSVSGI